MRAIYDCDMIFAHYSVTVTVGAKDAVSMINQQEGKFDLVMAKSNMPDMDALSFLHLLHEKDIPIICKFHLRVKILSQNVVSFNTYIFFIMYSHLLWRIQ